MAKRSLNKLSVTFVGTTKELGRHSDGGGLYLFIDAESRRRWIFMYSRNGNRVELGLGSGRDLPLADARALASKLRAVLEKGGDPRPELGKERFGKTFQEAAEAFIDRRESGWRNEKHRQQWRNTLESYTYPLIGKDGETLAPIFPASWGGQLSSMAMPILLRRMDQGRKGEGRSGWIDPKAGGRMIAVHGFRSTFPRLGRGTVFIPT